MTKFQAEKTKLTPEVTFDLEKNILSLEGNSIPENSNTFYLPLLEWIEDNSLSIMKNSNKMRITVDLVYFNSSSLKQIIKMFIKCQELANDQIDVTWFCENANDDFMETGLDISNALSIPFHFDFRKH